MSKLEGIVHRMVGARGRLLFYYVTSLSVLFRRGQRFCDWILDGNLARVERASEANIQVERWMCQFVLRPRINRGHHHAS